MIENSTDSPLVREMQSLLEKAKEQHCHEVTIELLEQAVLHQRISEDIAEIEKESSREFPQKENP